MNSVSSAPAAGPLVVFHLGERRCALPLLAVERVIRVVAVTRLPRAPAIVLGIINVRGRVIPVIDVRRRFGLPPRAIELTDSMVIARAGRRLVALVADSLGGVLESHDPDVVAAREILPEIPYVEGVVKLEDGLILIHNLERFLSLEEEAMLDRSIE